jgi:hypothetical protein
MKEKEKDVGESGENERVEIVSFESTSRSRVVHQEKKEKLVISKKQDEGSVSINEFSPVSCQNYELENFNLREAQPINDLEKELQSRQKLKKESVKNEETKKEDSEKPSMEKQVHNTLQTSKIQTHKANQLFLETLSKITPKILDVTQ